MNKIYIPKNPNLDVMTTAWLVSSVDKIDEVNIQTVPATWGGESMTDNDICIGLNSPEGGLGLRIRYGVNNGGKMKSCFSYYLEGVDESLAAPFNSLATYLDLSLTSKGPWPRTNKDIRFNPHLVDLTYVYESMKNLLNSRVDDEENNFDQDLLAFWFEIMDAYSMKQKSNSRAQDIAEQIEIKDVDGIGVACVETTDGIPAQAISKFLFYRDADIIIYKETNHVGVIRSRKAVEPDLTLLQDHLDEDGWYFYPKGTMAARGTRSRPVDTPSKYTLEDLFEIVSEIIEYTAPVSTAV